MPKPYNLPTALAVIIALFGLACSGTGTQPTMSQEVPDGLITSTGSQINEGNNSNRTLWGIWSFDFDPINLSIETVPLRDVQVHFNVTPFLLPPNCGDCLKIKVNSFDTVTRILDADATLRNPTQLTGHDVRGILYTNDYGHELLNADDWTGLWDIAGGQTINPFKAFAKAVDHRAFPPGFEDTGKYLVYIPIPPQWEKITFAADASWPGNCREPYEITNFQQETIMSDTGSSGSISIDVADWQNDVIGVSLVAPEIIGTGWGQFTHLSGNTWGMELVNIEGAAPGVYHAETIAASENSGAVLLCDFVEITISGEGIAGKYPGDEGIENDPDVIFVENFEEGSLTDLFSNWEDVKNKQNIAFSNDVPYGSGGNQSLKVHHVGGQDTGAHLYRRLLPGYDQLYFRAYVKFNADCGQIHHSFHAGGYNPSTPWPQGGAGEKPAGDERFTTGVEPFGNAWRWDFYSYWMEMRGSPDGYFWGNDFINDPALTAERGKWVCIELMMKMNNPVTEHNGEMELWINGQSWEKDGQLISYLGQGFPNGGWVWDSFIPNPSGEPFEGFRWRKDDNLKLNFLWLLVYITAAPDGHISEVWFDQVVAAKKYIGPISPK